MPKCNRSHLRLISLRLQRPPGGSLRDIQENAEWAFHLRLYPYAIAVLRAVHSAIQVEPSISLNCFKSLSLRNRPARGRGQTWRNTLRPDIGNLIAQPGSVAEVRDRPFVALFGCAVYLTHTSQLPFGCRVVCSVVVARHCVCLFIRRSASSNFALAVQRYAWEHSQSEPYFSGGLPRGGTPCSLWCRSRRGKVLPNTTPPTLHLP
jgi:hypothetical protein